MTPGSVAIRSDGVIDPWLTALWGKVYSLYPSLADVVPLSDYEPWVLTCTSIDCFNIVWNRFPSGSLWQAPSDIYVPLPGREGWHSKPKFGSLFARTASAVSLQTSVKFKSNGGLTFSGCQAYWLWHHWIQHWVSAAELLAIKANMDQTAD